MVEITSIRVMYIMKERERKGTNKITKDIRTQIQPKQTITTLPGAQQLL
jgi:hypothetical protein